ncbi:hypothetical protein BGX20_011389 [Mortierella sp. AD010]|nr:hypothetical protein BGX20_011389 [Mortierella sp. AD010]
MSELDNVATRSVKVHQFLKGNTVRFLHDLDIFSLYCNTLKHSRNHFATYIKSLNVISANENVPEKFRSHVDNILHGTAINSFTQACKKYVNQKNTIKSHAKTISTILKVVKDGASDAEEIASSLNPSHKNKRLDARLELGNFRSAINVEGAHAGYCMLKKRADSEGSKDSVVMKASTAQL